MVHYATEKLGKSLRKYMFVFGKVGGGGGRWGEYETSRYHNMLKQKVEMARSVDIQGECM